MCNDTDASLQTDWLIGWFSNGKNDGVFSIYSKWRWPVKQFGAKLSFNISEMGLFSGHNKIITVTCQCRWNFCGEIRKLAPIAKRQTGSSVVAQSSPDFHSRIRVEL